MSEAPWLEISLTVDGELAEPVAEVLARFIPDGVVIESTAVTAGPDDSEGHAIGPLRVYGFLPTSEGYETVRNQIEEALWYLGRIRPLPTPQFRPVQLANWAEAWKQHYHPIAIGKKIIIIPAWLDIPDDGRIPIRIDPGMAFGTGTHPTTQLCLELIEAYFAGELSTAPEAAPEVIDMGCGSGILAIAALKLGARHALGVDIDADAIRASRENAAANQVYEGFEIELGSLGETLAGKFSLSTGKLVLANILAPVIIRLFDEGLGEILAPGGVMILSGILAEQVDQVRAAFEKYGFRLVEQRLIGDWAALAIARS